LSFTLSRRAAPPGRARAVLGLLLALLVAGAAVPSDAAGDDPVESLARARQLYNAARYDEAIEAARDAAADETLRDAAWVVIGRAYLERYRRTDAVDDLAAARLSLRRVDPRVLGLGDQTELLLGLGQALYHESAFGAAAEMFATVVDRPFETGLAGRERALDWWASAVDRLAYTYPPAERHGLYSKVVERMEKELQGDPGSSAACYWLAAAARGRGDLDRAWAVARAGWLRATFARDGGAALRADLDRLVVQAIIPERARRQVRPQRDLAQIMDGMLSDWEALKSRWSPR
jgi:tetratricopeptide (TPR) repeat protein